MKSTRGKGFGAPAPVEVRIAVRTGRAPALAVGCPHCGARAWARCTSISGRHPITSLPVHDARHHAWAVTIACCPTCQVEPGVPCHHEGRPLPHGEAHPARLKEAEVTA